MSQVQNTTFQHGGGGASQLTKSSIGMTLYEKRGRNGKGPIMFHHMGPGAGRASGAPGSDVNVGGAQHSLPSNLNGGASGPGGVGVGLHHRNKTQIVGGIEAGSGPGSDSVFRSSIMSTDQIQRHSQINNQILPANGASVSIQQNTQLGKAIQHRFSAKAPGGQQTQASKVYAR